MKFLIITADKVRKVSHKGTLIMLTNELKALGTSFKVVPSGFDFIVIPLVSA